MASNAGAEKATAPAKLHVKKLLAIFYPDFTGLTAALACQWYTFRKAFCAILKAIERWHLKLCQGLLMVYMFICMAVA